MSRHQRGYIFEAHGAYHVRYYALVGGVRKQLSHRLCAKDRSTGHGSPSAKAVREACEEFMRAVNTESLPNVGTSLQVVTFWDTIYLPFIEQNLKHSTVEGYKQIWTTHLKVHFGSTLLREYKTPAMSLLLTHLAKTLRPRTLQHIKFLASATFSHAVATGECDSNPIRDAMVLGKTLENGQTQVYTLEDIENVISALVDHLPCQLIMALTFFLGLRAGEVAGLQWGDVDSDFIHIRRAYVRGVIGTPKTQKSVRSVPLIEPVRGILGLWRSTFYRLGYCKRHSEAGCKTCRTVGWVFPNQKGDPVNLKDLARSVIRPALAASGVPWKGYHAGRRGLGTTLRALTGNSNAGRDMLGHSTDAVTKAHYEGVMPEEVLKGMKMLEERVINVNHQTIKT